MKTWYTAKIQCLGRRRSLTGSECCTPGRAVGKDRRPCFGRHPLCHADRTEHVLFVQVVLIRGPYILEARKLRHDYPSAPKVTFDPALIFLSPRSNFLGFRYMGEWKASVALRWFTAVFIQAFSERCTMLYCWLLSLLQLGSLCWIPLFEIPTTGILKRKTFGDRSFRVAFGQGIHIIEFVHSSRVNKTKSLQSM